MTIEYDTLKILGSPQKQLILPELGDDNDIAA